MLLYGHGVGAWMAIEAGLQLNGQIEFIDGRIELINSTKTFKIFFHSL